MSPDPSLEMDPCNTEVQPTHTVNPAQGQASKTWKLGISRQKGGFYYISVHRFLSQYLLRLITQWGRQPPNFRWNNEDSEKFSPPVQDHTTIGKSQESKTLGSSSFALCFQVSSGMILPRSRTTPMSWESMISKLRPKMLILREWSFV